MIVKHFVVRNTWDVSVAVWLANAVNGERKDYGLALVDKAY